MIDEEIRQSLQEEFVLGIFWCFELDRKAQMDLMLLARQGEVGRCEANAIILFRLGPEFRLPGPQQQDVLHGDRGPQKSRQRWDLDAVAFSSQCT